MKNNGMSESFGPNNSIFYVHFNKFLLYRCDKKCEKLVSLVLDWRSIFIFTPYVYV